VTTQASTRPSVRWYTVPSPEGNPWQTFPRLPASSPLIKCPAPVFMKCHISYFISHASYFTHHTSDVICSYFILHCFIFSYFIIANLKYDHVKNGLFSDFSIAFSNPHFTFHTYFIHPFVLCFYISHFTFILIFYSS
jgi:hypothetical protein